MTTSRPTITTINDTFSEFKENLNTVSLDLGATGRLTTGVDSDVVGAVNELDSDLHGPGGGKFRTDFNFVSMPDSAGTGTVTGALNAIDALIGGSPLETEADTITGAVNEIEGVFDASAGEINVTEPGADLDVAVANDFNVDAGGEVSFDAASGEAVFRKNGTVFGMLADSDGDLVIRSGSETFLWTDGINARLRGNLIVEGYGRINGSDFTAAGEVYLGGDAGCNLNFLGGVCTDIIPATTSVFNRLGISSSPWNEIHVRTVFARRLDADSADIGGVYVSPGQLDFDSDLTIQSLNGEITLDAGDDGGTVTLKDRGSKYGSFTHVADEMIISSSVEAAIAINSDGNTNILGDLLSGGPLTMGGNVIQKLSGSLKIYAAANLILDANGGNVYFDDNTARFGRFRKAGTSGMAFSTGWGDVFTSEGDKFAVHVPLVPDSDLSTSAETVVGAVNEHEADLGDMSLATSADDLTSAINEHEADLGDMSLATSADDLTGAVNELHSTLGKNIDSDGPNGNLADNNVGLGLFRLDSAVGNLANLDGNDVGNRLNLVSAINSVGAAVSQLDSGAGAFDDRIGSLANLDNEFTGTERDSVINALNSLRAAIPDIYDDTGTLLN